MNFTITNAYLSIVGDNLNLSITKEYTDGSCKLLTWTGHRYDDLFEFCVKHEVESFQCSSNIDYPLDATDNRLVLETCARLRGFDLEAYIERDAKIKAECAEIETDDETDDEIAVGDTVRSFDFAETLNDGTEYGRDLAGERACYVIGKVVANDKWIEGCNRYTIRVISMIFGGKVVEDSPEFIYPPINGTPKFSGVCNGVEKI